MSEYLLSLFLTIGIELAVTVIFGFTRIDFIEAVICINLITHPLLNIAVSAFHIQYLLLIILLECLVVLAEWGFLLYTFRKPRYKLLLLSFFMNLASYLICEGIF